ncbi:DMT family transporter [Rossellomorea marisflavi]|uniref:DMT family transporter n=1 Tax=Rossellomorea marisflavi TaxID=189381 RepID=UPI00203CF4A2|nr:DMT family transporter [Rossellomorea marisflavi]MCM2591416.1 DMT family transporter [Rossellomorea marisflavi]
MHQVSLLRFALAMAIFGSVGFFSKLTGLPYIELIAVRLLCAALFLFVIWLFKRERRIGSYDWREVGMILLCAVANLLNWLCLFASFEKTSVTIAISLYHLAPLFVLIAGRFLFRERWQSRTVFAIALSFIGTICIMGLKAGGFSLLDGEGIAYGMMAALFYAVTMLLGKGVTKSSLYAVTLLQMIIGLLILLPFVDYSAFFSLSYEQWGYSILTGVVHTGFVYLLFFQSLRHLTARTISLMVFIDPAVAILLDILLSGFRPDRIQSVGIILIFAGMLVSISPRKRKTADALELDKLIS